LILAILTQSGFTAGQAGTATATGASGSLSSMRTRAETVHVDARADNALDVLYHPFA
jgi:hypothetical protein